MQSVQNKLKEAESILKEVQSMQTLQTEYFSTRDRNILQQSKAQERKVKKMIKDYFDYKHPTLW